MKRLLAMLLAVTMLLSCLPATAFAAAEVASGTCGDALTWVLTDDGTLTISGEGAMTNYSSTNQPWYSYQSSITSVVLEEGVTTIGKNAFDECCELTSVTFPDSLQSIGQYAFSGCNGLTRIDLPNGVTDMDAGAFRNCINLEEVTIPESITSLAEDLFVCCYSLTTVNLPDSLTTIGASAFEECESLTEFVCPDGLVEIGARAFNSCYNLTSFTFGSNVQTIGGGAFLSSGLTQVELPDSLKTIGGSAFSSSPLKEVTIPAKVETIGDEAFMNCRDLQTVSIPASVQSIGSRAFYDCILLTGICVDEDNANYCDENGVVYTKDKTHLLVCPAGYTGTHDICQGTEVIDAFAFSACTGLTAVTIPDSVLTISNIAFDRCTGLTTLTIPASVQSIGSSAFGACTGLETVYFEGDAPECGEEYIFDGEITAYYPADNETWTEEVRQNYGDTITWEAYVEEGGEECAHDFQPVEGSEEPTCTESAEVEFVCVICQDPDVSYVDVLPALGHSFADGACQRCGEEGPMVIETGSCGTNATWALSNDGILTVSGTGAIDDGLDNGMYFATPFDDMENYDMVTKVIIEEGITRIGEHAFRFTQSITQVEMADTVTSIGDMAFWMGINLEQVTFSQNLQTIGQNAFENCTELTEITIPASVTSIGYHAFGCELEGISKLETITFLGDAPDFPAYVYEDEETGETTTDENEAFCYVTATAYYPAGNDTWTEEVRQNYGGTITWVAVSDGPAQVASGTCGDALTWTLYDDGTFVFSGSGEAYTYWDSSDLPWYTHMQKIRTVVVEDGVTHLPNYSFHGTQITSVDLGNTLQTIGMSTFSDCTGLTQIELPDSLTTLGHDAFSACENLTRIVIPDSVTSVGMGAFWYCYDLQSVEYSASCSAIDLGTFRECHSLTEFIIPDSVTYIGEGAFYNCDSLTQITIPVTVQGIDYQAFAETDQLTEVTVLNPYCHIGTAPVAMGSLEDEYAAVPAGEGTPDTLGIPGTAVIHGYDDSTAQTFAEAFGYEFVSLGVAEGIDPVVIASGDCGDNVTWTLTSDGVFTVSGTGPMEEYRVYDEETDNYWYYFTPWGEWKDRIRQVVIQEGVTTVGSDAFSECTNLTSVTMADSVETIGAMAFSGCTGLNQITLSNNLQSIEMMAFYDCSGLAAVALPEGLIYIAEDAFMACSSLKELVIPNSVTHVGNAAFASCSGLESVTISGNMTTIAVRTFVNCSGLTSITIPDSVTTIEGYAFNGCTGLTSVTIPASVTELGTSVFYYCNSLTEILVDENNPNYSSLDGVLFNKDQTVLVQYPAGRSGSYTVPEGVTTIGFCAFLECTGLTGVVLPDSVTTIEDSAFAGCSGLDSIVIGENVAQIGAGALASCSNLQQIIVEENNSAYSSEDGVLFNKDRTVLLQYPSGRSGSYAVPEGVTTIGSQAFWGCQSLYEVSLPDSVVTLELGAFGRCTALEEVDLGNGVTTIGSQAFWGCSGLFSITLPDSVTTIGADAFSNCGRLNQVNLGNSVESIDDWAFYGTDIGCMILPESLQSIGYAAFGCCYNLQELEFKGDAPAFADDVFFDVVTTVRYPEDASGWDDVVGNDYGGTITWEAYAPAPAQVASGTCGDALTWVLTEDGVLTISGEGAMYDYAGEDRPWKDYQNTIQSVVVQEGVTSVGSFAFSECSELTNVTLPASVESIGFYPFYGCGKLTTLQVSSDNASFCTADNVLFTKDMTELVLMPEGYTGTYEVPDSVTSIGENAFYNCAGLTQLVIPDSVTSIGDFAFGFCSGLTAVTLPENITALNHYTFYQCHGLTEITVPDSVTFIGEFAFYECNGLQTVTLGTGVAEIGSYAFGECDSVIDVTKSGDAPNIASDAFEGTTVNFSYPADNTTWDGVAGNDYGGTITWEAAGGVTYHTIAEAKAFTDASMVYTLKGIVTYVSGKTVYMEDATGGICVYFSTTADASGIALGDELVVTDTMKTYGGQIETNYTTAADIQVLSSGNALPSQTVTLAALVNDTTNEYLCERVVIENVTMGTINTAGDTALTDANGNTLNLYRATGMSGQINARDIVTVTAIVSTYNGYRLLLNPGTAAADVVEIVAGAQTISVAEAKAGTVGTDYQVEGTVTFIRDENVYIQDETGAIVICLNAAATNTAVGDKVKAYGTLAVEKGLIKLSGVEETDTECYEILSSGNSVAAQTVTVSQLHADTTNEYLAERVSISDATIVGVGAYDTADMCVSYVIDDGTGDIMLHCVPITGEEDVLAMGSVIDLVAVVSADDSYQLLPVELQFVSSCIHAQTSLCNAKTATCNEEGYTGDSVCTLCQTVVSTGSTIPMLGHTFVGDSCTNCGIAFSSMCGENLTWSISDLGVLTISGTGAMYEYTMDGQPWQDSASSVIKVVIEKGATTIGDYAFAYFEKLGSVEIPDSVLTIGEGAFCGCEELIDIFVPGSVTRIEEAAFRFCTNMLSIYVDETNTCYMADDSGVLFNKAKTELIQAPEAISGTYAIPDGVTSIDNYAFVGCKNLTGVTLPNSITAIGDFAFNSCNNLTSINIPYEVRTIGQWAFASCDLTSLTLPESVGTIGMGAFARNENLTEITFTGDAPSFGTDVFYNVTATAYYPADNATWTEDVRQNYGGTITWEAVGGDPAPDSALTVAEAVALGESKESDTYTEGKYYVTGEITLVCNSYYGAMYITDGAGNVLYLTKTYNEDGTIPYEEMEVKPFMGDTVTAYGVIGKFDGEAAMQDGWITEHIPAKSVSGICGENLTWVFTDDGVFTVSGEGAMFDYDVGSVPWFERLPSITKVVIGEGVTALGTYAFEGCSALTEITFLGDAPTIGVDTFTGVTATAYYPAGNATWTEDVRQNYGGNITWVAMCDHAQMQLKNEKDPTCTEPGYSGDTVCIVCGQVLTSGQEIPATGHSYNAEVTDPTCTESGYTDYICTVCGDSYTGDETAALGHSYNAEVTAPTCTEPGYTTYTCTACGYSYTGDETAALGHSYNAEVTAPTCTEPGYTTYTCTACGYSYTGDETAATGHTYVDGVCACGDVEILLSGSCGESVNFVLYGTGLLKIFGEGSMEDYRYTNTPWYSQRRSITAVAVEEGVTGIGDYAFYNCVNLTDVSMADSVIRVGNSAFYGCDLLRTLVFGNGVETIGSYVFLGSSALTSVTLPESLKSIGIGAFHMCSALKEITFPEGLQTIGSQAFYGCKKLTTVTIPASVQTIDSGAFESCNQLKEVLVDENNANYTSVDGVLLTKDMTQLLCFPCNSNMTVYRIPQGVTTIGTYAFVGCTNLTAVTIPDSVETIGAQAFLNCSSLTSVTMGSGVKTLGNDAFRSCSKLASITLPDSVETIGTYAFSGCTSLETFVVPAGIKQISDYMFYYCTGLKSITIPANITSIGTRSFWTCTDLQQIRFLGNAPSFGQNAFEGVTATACYLVDNTTWTSGVLQNYGGTITWQTWCIHGQTRVDNAKDPTCTEAGDTGDTLCLICGQTVEESQQIPALGHTYGNWVTTAAPTTTAEGLRTKLCTLCGDAQTQAIPMLEDTSAVILENTTDAAQNDLSASADLTYEAVAEDEAAGDYVTVELMVEEVSSESVADSTKEQVDEQANFIVEGLDSNYDSTGSVYMDIDLIKQVGTEEPQIVTETNEPVTVTIQVPQELQSETKIYNIIRVHDGVAEVLPCTYDAATGMLTFQTDRFSNYTLFWVETAVEEIPLDLVLGQQTLSLAEGQQQSFQWVVPKDGDVTVTMESGSWQYSAQVEHADGTIQQTPLYSTADDAPVETVTFTVCGGDKLLLTVAGQDLGAGDVTFRTEFQSAREDEVVVAVLGDVGYTSVSAALAAAKSGDTVTLIGDAQDSYIIITPGVTLDLDCYTLTADYVIGLKGSSLIGDNYSLTKAYAKLMVDKDNVALSSDVTTKLPVWMDDHYVFMSSALQKIQVSASEGTMKLEFTPNETGAVLNLMKQNGSSPYGISIVIRVSYTETQENGDINVTREYVYTDKLVKYAYENSVSLTVEMEGCDALQDLVFTIVVASDVGPENASAAYAYNDYK